MRWIEKRRLSAESGFWNTICSARTCSRSRLAILPATGLPSSSTIEPSSGSVRPSSSRASVVLPLPDSPTRPSVSPGRNASAISSTAWISCPSCLNVLRRCSARTTGGELSSTELGIGTGGSARGSSGARSQKWQRDLRPEPSSWNAGSSFRQTSWAMAQRST